MNVKRGTITCSLRYLVALATAMAAVVLCLVLLLALRVHERTVKVRGPTGFDPARNWGYLSAYDHNTDDVFGIKDVGLTQSCQIIQAHVLQRSAQRLPTAYFEEGNNDERFARKVTEWSRYDPNRLFAGSLSFLNSCEYSLNNSGALTRAGAATEFIRGSAAWNKYGRGLYGSEPFATPSRARPFIRSAGSDHVTASVPYWLAGFYHIPQSAVTSLEVAPTP